MHGTLDRSGKSQNHTDRSWILGFFAIPVILVIVLTGLAMTQPAAFSWISEAAQAEFVGTNSPGIAPTQLAQPAGETHAVRAN
jgi:quinol-cytochrome oxidoreductase complex cytochrome b subunit